MIKDIKMTYKIINIPEQYDYIDKVPEFQKDVPDNVYIDKIIHSLAECS